MDAAEQGGNRREEIRAHYAQVAASIVNEATHPGKDACDSGASSALTSACCCERPRLYPEDLQVTLPTAVLSASRGCGNPLAEATLEASMAVLDLGCGGGIDCLIAARQVGPTGKVYGLDMTDEMLELAERNRCASGAENVEFLKGFIEDIPLPDTCVDLVTSNCVINLSEDKPRVLREARRVLRPGGSFVVADIVACKPGFEGEAGLEAARVFGCRAGVIDVGSYRAMMRDAGFADIELRVYKRYSLERLREKAAAKGLEHVFSSFSDAELDGAFGGAFIQGRRP